MDSVGHRREPFLSDLSQRCRTIITSAFAEAVRSREFSKKSDVPLVAATVRTTVDNLSQTFQDFAQADPVSTKEERLQDFYNSSTKAIKRAIQKSAMKKQSQ